MRRLRRWLLFIGIVCGLCVVFVYTVLMPAVEEIFECIGFYPTRITHLVWSEDSQNILIRLETPAEFYGSIERIMIVPTSPDEQVNTGFLGDTVTQFGVNFEAIELSLDGVVPTVIFSPNQQWWASLRIGSNNLDVYIRADSDENERLLFRFQPEGKCFSWDVR